MFIRHFRSRLFLTYLLSNVLVFLLPVAVLGKLMYENAVVNLRSEIESATMSKLAEARDVTERNMRELSRIAAKISYDPSLTPYMVRNDRYSSLEAIEELSRYQALNGVTEDVFLYYRGDSDIYSGIGVSSVETFLNSHYSLNDEDKAEFANQINTIERPYIYPVQSVMFNYEPTRMLTYMFPIKELTPYGTVLFWIRESKMTDLVENTLSDFQGRAIIVQDTGTVIAESARGSELPEEKMLELVRQTEQEGLRQFKWNGEKFSIAMVRSESMGWKFAAIMPTDQFFGRVFEKRTFILLVLLLVLTTGLLAALFMSMNLYRPIRKLTRFTREKIGLADGGTRNELELIRHSLEATVDKQANLEERLETQRPWVRDLTLIRLLTGGLGENDKEVLARLVPEQEGRPFQLSFVMLVAPADSSSGNPAERSGAFDREQILKQLYKFDLPGGIGLGVELIQERAIAVFILVFDGAGDDHPKAVQRRSGLHVQGLIQDNLGLSWALAIGNPATELLQANRSFIEASAALEYAVKLDRTGAVFFDEMLEQQGQSAWFPAEEQLKLVHSLKKGDEAVALESLRIMIASISGQQQSLLLLKCMCIDIVNTLFKTVRELNLKPFDAEIKSLVEFTSLAALEAEAAALVRRVCAAVTSRKEAEFDHLRAQVTEYIHKQYSSYSLTLESAADRFGLSPSSMSRLFKDTTGSAFTDYVSKLRMKEIKRQLTETGLPIKDIIASVGYADVSTFVRKFKKSEGLTPGEYRKLYGRSSIG
ncbi:helix-turn-helix domain-containing protein [Cohnella fermenti]|nr:helix-turn-helix domain-containing protein [Cohnella fermenti]